MFIEKPGDITFHKREKTVENNKANGQNRIFATKTNFSVYFRHVCADQGLSFKKVVDAVGLTLP